MQEEPKNLLTGHEGGRDETRERTGREVGRGQEEEKWRTIDKQGEKEGGRRKQGNKRGVKEGWGKHMEERTEADRRSRGDEEEQIIK